VKEVFEERLRAALPLRADRVLRRIRETRGGKMNDPRFGSRGAGEGPYAESIGALFEATTRKLGLATGREGWDESPVMTFERPLARKQKAQLGLF